MASKEQICTMALGFLGEDEEIVNFDTEKGASARALRRNYEPVLEDVLRAFNWPFARKTATLQLVEEDPTNDWSFAYRYPVDCAKARRIPSGIRNETRQDQIPFIVAAEDAGGLIYTDLADAELEYTRKGTSTELMPGDFVRAFAYLLSTAIGPSIMAGDPFGMISKNLQLYQLQIERAQSAAANEQVADVEPEAEILRDR